MRRASWKESWLPWLGLVGAGSKCIGLQKQAQRRKLVSTELFQNLPEEGLAKSQEASVQDLTAFCACV